MSNDKWPSLEIYQNTRKNKSKKSYIIFELSSFSNLMCSNVWDNCWLKIILFFFLFPIFFLFFFYLTSYYITPFANKPKQTKQTKDSTKKEMLNKRRKRIFRGNSLLFSIYIRILSSYNSGSTIIKHHDICKDDRNSFILKMNH